MSGQKGNGANGSTGKRKLFVIANGA